MNPEQSIAHYRIVSKLGEGGMGEVWRATDTKLNRDVAIKVLPDAFASDPDRLARFTREAQVLASLNHPNIAAIYGVEERALVMELVEGTTLAERIRQGPVPVPEALEIARQIAEALEAAHEKGVVHRDLKPANIKVTAEGRVKVLDFGLAKAMAAETISGDPVNSPTLTMRSTMAGVIVGTAGYMAPEQARGNTVDKRADIWAFGVVLYEMFTGRSLFAGETLPDTLAAVLAKEPQWQVLPANLAPTIGTMLRRCLERDPRRRLRDIGDARLELEQPVEETAIPARAGRSWPLGITAGVLAVGLLATGVAWWRAGRPAEAPLMRFTADMGSDAPSSPLLTEALSLDGRRIVHPVRTSVGTQLATRLLHQSESTILPGTEDGLLPFFSPDGQWVGFFAGDKLKKVSVLGGAAVTLSEAASGPRGGWWGEDGTIIATLDIRHLFRVSASGNKEEMLAADPAANGYTTYRWPQILPGGEVVLITAGGNPGEFDTADIGIIFLKTGKFKLVTRGGYYGRYLPSGHLIYIHQGSLYAVPFNIQRLESRGVPVPVLEDVAGHPATGSGNLAFSQTGTLLYMAGNGRRESDSAVWMDATGRLTPLFTASGGNMTLTPRISGDGTRLAVGINGDISVFDIGRGTLTRITLNHGPNGYPVWTPDGRHIAYSAPDGICWTRADGSSHPQRLLENKGGPVPCSFSPDGQRLAFHEAGGQAGRAISILPLDTSDPEHPKAGRPEPFGQHEIDPVFSPDGRWLASTSLDLPLPQVYVRPYPPGAAGGARWQVSTSPGHMPAWSSNGRELFYVTLGGQIMAVDYTERGGTFSPGKPRIWCPKPVFLSGLYPHLDLSPDGKRVEVLALENSNDTNATLHVTFLLNFFDELKRKVQ